MLISFSHYTDNRWQLVFAFVHTAWILDGCEHEILLQLRVNTQCFESQIGTVFVVKHVAHYELRVLIV